METMMTGAETLELLKGLEEKIIDPAQRHSPEALARLLSDELLEFAASGTVYDKPTVLAALAAENPSTWVEMTNHDYKLRVLAEGLVLLTYRHVGKRSDGAEARSLRASIWKLVDGRWQLVFHQGTPTSGG